MKARLVFHLFSFKLNEAKTAGGGNLIILVIKIGYFISSCVKWSGPIVELTQGNEHFADISSYKEF